MPELMITVECGNDELFYVVVRVHGIREGVEGWFAYDMTGPFHSVDAATPVFDRMNELAANDDMGMMQ